MSQKDEISVESGHDTAFAKDSGKTGIVKDTQAGIVGDNAKAEGGIHQHTQKAEGAKGPVHAENIGRVVQHFYQDTRLWIAVIAAIVCLVSVLIFSGGDTEQKIIGNNNTAVITRNGDVSIGISPERFEKLVTEFGVTKSALVSFFKILEQKQVPPEDLDSTLREIAKRYKELQAKLTSAPIYDSPKITALKKKAKEALEKGDFDRAEKLLNKAADKVAACAGKLWDEVRKKQEEAKKCSLSAAESKAQISFQSVTTVFQMFSDFQMGITAAKLYTIRLLNIISCCT